MALAEPGSPLDPSESSLGVKTLPCGSLVLRSHCHTCPTSARFSSRALTALASLPGLCPPEPIEASSIKDQLDNKSDPSLPPQGRGLPQWRQFRPPGLFLKTADREGYCPWLTWDAAQPTRRLASPFIWICCLLFVCCLPPQNSQGTLRPKTKLLTGSLDRYLPNNSPFMSIFRRASQKEE